MVGRGRMSISGAVDLANSMVVDGMVHDAVESFASLGTSGQHLGNCERDLHRWMDSRPIQLPVASIHSMDGSTRHLLPNSGVNFEWPPLLYQGACPKSFVIVRFPKYYIGLYIQGDIPSGAV